MRIMLENLFSQYVDYLNGKLIYIYAEKKHMKNLYQYLLDNNILYFFDTSIKDANDINDIQELVRITSKNDEFGKFNKFVKHRRFAPTYKRPEHYYSSNGIFAYEHSGFIVINYEYLLRKKKIDKLVEITK